MRSVFISPHAEPLSRWRVAFADLQMRHDVDDYMANTRHSDDLCWLDVSSFSSAEAEAAVKRLTREDARVVALSAAPQEAEAVRLISAGARGYCHADAVPEQLLEVKQVVAAGGYWMQPGLVQRMVAIAARVDPDTPQPEVEGFDALTHREYEVAALVGKGANNKEIAELLGVSERTVKAHLTAIFEKLELRDRVQLALAVNRLPYH
ncbi:transcriptional regulator, LuxR family [Luminiphilus syltensis NOR5-1B]|uniref:Transcriptional regulator, LuxR family n=1 Tax=Luminiphilus syltensis NOR5-1B TaxID=565045 RepID=B8KRU1_9GAMM|nr:response regulator transcription factor [Luminiphilus syltensis]EED36525.1 transcriptional regulator, LuxR family [Luminiphilus syltensis NOR5-1B]